MPKVRNQAGGLDCCYRCRWFVDHQENVLFDRNPQYRNQRPGGQPGRMGQCFVQDGQGIIRLVPRGFLCSRYKDCVWL